VPGGDECGPKQLDYWFSDKVIPPRKPGPPGRQIMLADLPAACKGVLEAADKKTSVATDNLK
jgi:penicillin-insensitive murein endopeptidase